MRALMPELRFDPLGRRSVLLAPERARRGAPDVRAVPPGSRPVRLLRRAGGAHTARDVLDPPRRLGTRHAGLDRPRRPEPLPRDAVPRGGRPHAAPPRQRYEDQDPSRADDVVLAYRERVRAAPTPRSSTCGTADARRALRRSHAHGQIFGLDDVPADARARDARAFADDCVVLCSAAKDDDLLVTDPDELSRDRAPRPVRRRRAARRSPTALARRSGTSSDDELGAATPTRSRSRSVASWR